MLMFYTILYVYLAALKEWKNTLTVSSRDGSGGGRKRQYLYVWGGAQKIFSRFWKFPGSARSTFWQRGKALGSETGEGLGYRICYKQGLAA
jgi:hypothetical protein